MPAKLDSTIYANDTPFPKGGYTNSTQEIEKDAARAEGENIYEDTREKTFINDLFLSEQKHFHSLHHQ